jgi:prepilin-type N-terminal cleavage/methylation domain-containing protein
MSALSKTPLCGSGRRSLEGIPSRSAGRRGLARGWVLGKGPGKGSTASLAARARGFSLIEVMIAMVVLLVGLTGTTAAIAYSQGRGVQARKTTAAQMLATEVLERLRLEVRYDAEPTAAGCGGTTNHGCVGEDEFTTATAWKADRLPYASADAVAGDGTCNPPGTEDGVTYSVGPFPVRYEQQDYQVCYRLETTASDLPGIPPLSLDARVKVLYRTGDGFGARWASALLTAGR